MKKIAKTDNKKVVILPEWAQWTCYGVFLVCMINLVFCSIPAAFALHPFLGFVQLCIFGLAGYFGGTMLMATPVLIMVQKQIEANEYFQMEVSQRRTIKLIDRLHLPKDATYMTLWLNLGLSELNQGKYEDAEGTHIKTIAMLDKLKRKQPWVLILARLNYAVVLLRQNRLHEALQVYDECEEKANSLPTIEPLSRVFISMGRAKAFLLFSDFEEASLHLQLASDAANDPSFKSYFRKSGPVFSFAYCAGMALINARRGEMDQSRDYFQQLQDIARSSPTSYDVNNGFTLAELARTYIESGDVEPAERALELAYNKARKHPTHPESQRVINVFTQLLETTGRKEEVPDMRQWIRYIPDHAAHVIVSTSSPK